MQIITWLLFLHTVDSVIIGDIQTDHGLEDSKEEAEDRAYRHGSSKPMEPECKPGEVEPHEDGCNTCVCASGIWACTMMGCPSGADYTNVWYRERRASDKQSKDPECKRGERSRAADGCNSCFCFYGKWACTLKMCPPGGFSPDFINWKGKSTASSRQSKDYTNVWYGEKSASGRQSKDPQFCSFVEEKKCQDEYIKTQCTNFCKPKLATDPQFCSFLEEKTCQDEYIKTQCTNFCKPKLATEPKCKPGEWVTVADYCNTCLCGFNGILACPRRGCPTGGFSDSTKWKGKIIASPRQSKELNANLRVFPELECKHGESKMVECNSCFCGSGNWWCTLKNCWGPSYENDYRRLYVASGRHNEDSQARSSVSETTEPECKEEAYKNEDCNSCFCYGGLWWCTMKLCIGPILPSRQPLQLKSLPNPVGDKAKNETEDSSGRYSEYSQARSSVRDFLNAVEPECTTGENIEMECNNCFCAGGQWICILVCIHSDLSFGDSIKNKLGDKVWTELKTPSGRHNGDENASSDLSFDETMKKLLGEKEWAELKNPSGRHRGGDRARSGENDVQSFERVQYPHSNPYIPKGRMGYPGLPRKPEGKIGNRGLPRDPRKTRKPYGRIGNRGLPRDPRKTRKPYGRMENHENDVQSFGRLQYPHSNPYLPKVRMVYPGLRRKPEGKLGNLGLPRDPRKTRKPYGRIGNRGFPRDPKKTRKQYGRMENHELWMGDYKLDNTDHWDITHPNDQMGWTPHYI